MPRKGLGEPKDDGPAAAAKESGAEAAMRVSAPDADLWDELARLRKHINQEWRLPVSGVELLEQDRR